MNSHLGALLPLVVIAVTWLLGARAARGLKRTGDRPAPPSGDDDARTRRVREEVQRRIAERRRAAGAPRAEAGAEPPRTAARPPSPLPPSRPPQPADEEDEAEAALQRQQSLAAQVRALEASRAAAQVRAQTAATAVALAAAPGLLPQDWLQELRDPRSVRRAVIAREILGPPVGLR